MAEIKRFLNSNENIAGKCDENTYWKICIKIKLKLEFVTCGVELLRGHCTDIPADQGSY